MNAPQESESEIFLDTPQGAASEDSANELRENERRFVFDEGGADTSGSGIFAVFRILFILALVALAIYGIVFFLKRGLRRENKESSYLKLLAAIPITPKTSAAVLAVGGKAWLAGVSDSSVTLLAEITDQETIDTMLLDYAQRAASSSTGKTANFLGLLQKLLPQQAADVHGHDGAYQADNLRKNRDKLRGL